MLYKLDLAMLRTIDGERKDRIEFEERCRLRTLAAFGVRVTFDDRRIAHVDWSTVQPERFTR
jgi:hypothetical protein